MKNIWFIILPFVFYTSCKKNTRTDPVVPEPPIVLDTSYIFARGTNLSNCFNDYSDPAQFTNRFTPAHLNFIKKNGFTYVRIPVGSTILYNAANPSALHQTNLAFVDAAIDNALSANLGVTLNLHPLANDIDSQLANDPNYVTKIAAYWKSVASYFGKYPADKLSFEILNEPHASAAGLTTKDFSWWQDVQGEIVSAVRTVDSTHSIIVGGEGWNSINGLLQIKPYPFKKIIYTFHFYDPFLFTHQGATWTGWQPAMDARNVPYPSSPQAVAPLIIASNSDDLNNNLRWYGEQRYNIDSLDKWIGRANDWGKANNVTIICNEFGSYKPFAPRQSRLNFLKDVTTVLKKYNIGWAMWDSDEGFGWMTFADAARTTPTADYDVLKSLGMR